MQRAEHLSGFNQRAFSSKECQNGHRFINALLPFGQPLCDLLNTIICMLLLNSEVLLIFKTLLEHNTVWIQIMPDNLSDLIWI